MNLFETSNSTTFRLQSSINLQTLDSLAQNDAVNQLRMEYEDEVLAKTPTMKPEGNLIIRSPGAPPFTIPFNSWENLDIIKNRISENLSCNLEPFHYVTDHGTIQKDTYLKDYFLQNNSIVLMVPKNQFEKERIKRRDSWIKKMKPKPKSSAKIIIPIKKVQPKRTRPPFYY